MSLEPAKADPEKVARKVAAAPGLKQPPVASYDLLPDGRVANYQMQPIGFKRKARNRIGSVIFNLLITHIPSHFIRQGFLRLFGADIGSNSSIGLGTTILDPEFLTIGNNTAIGFRCLLDARPGLYIGHNVTIASDVHFIGGGHDVNHPDFLPVTGDPSVIEDYTWIASRATLISAYVQRGAVVAAQALVINEVGECEIVGGVPAKAHRQAQSRCAEVRGRVPPVVRLMGTTLQDYRLVFVGPMRGKTAVGDYADDMAGALRPHFGEVVQVRTGGPGEDSLADIRVHRRAVAAHVAEAQRGRVLVHAELSAATLAPFWSTAGHSGVPVTSTVHDPPHGVWMPVGTRGVVRSRLLNHGIHYPARPPQPEVGRRGVRRPDAVRVDRDGTPIHRAGLPVDEHQVHPAHRPKPTADPARARTPKGRGVLRPCLPGQGLRADRGPSPPAARRHWDTRRGPRHRASPAHRRRRHPRPGRRSGRRRVLRVGAGDGGSVRQAALLRRELRRLGCGGALDRLLYAADLHGLRVAGRTR